MTKIILTQLKRAMHGTTFRSVLQRSIDSWPHVHVTSRRNVAPTAVHVAISHAKFFMYFVPSSISVQSPYLQTRFPPGPLSTVACTTFDQVHWQFKSLRMRITVTARLRYVTSDKNPDATRFADCAPQGHEGGVWHEQKAWTLTCNRCIGLCFDGGVTLRSFLNLVTCSSLHCAIH